MLIGGRSVLIPVRKPLRVLCSWKSLLSSNKDTLTRARAHAQGQRWRSVCTGTYRWLDRAYPILPREKEAIRRQLHDVGFWGTIFTQFRTKVLHSRPAHKHILHSRPTHVLHLFPTLTSYTHVPHSRPTHILARHTHVLTQCRWWSCRAVEEQSSRGVLVAL